MRNHLVSSLLALALLVMAVLACGSKTNDGDEVKPPPPCGCVKTAEHPATHAMTFRCEGPKGQVQPDPVITFGETAGNEKQANFLATLKCKCQQEPPPPQTPRPILYVCVPIAVPPPGHIFTGLGIDGTLCSDNVTGAWVSIACLRNTFLKRGDELTMCDGTNQYNSLSPDDKREIDQNWTITPHSADQFHCFRSAADNPPYWTLKKK